ncbi:MAG: M56 family metallopeptidase [Gemmatimonadaceae bacterium]
MHRRGVAYLTDTLALREQAHRRTTLLALTGLLFLSTSPVFGHHVATFGGALLLDLEHLGALCLTALHLILEPVHRIFHLIIIAGLLYATWDRLRAWRLARGALASLEARSPEDGDDFWEAARAAGIDPAVVRVVEGLPSPAFTTGWLRPRIYVAAALTSHLNPAELAAVLAHEAEHVARRDPLRLSMLRFLACTFFWIPALRRLADDLADESEVMADDAAAAGRPLVLASAILTLAQWEQRRWDSTAVAGFFRSHLVERRIRRLVGEDTAVRTHVTRRSVLSAALALSLVWSSGILVAHPLPAQDRAHQAGHCDHPGESAFAHLFCLSLSVAPAEDCPHHRV